MKLKTKILKWSAGGAVVMLHPKTAQALGVRVDSRLMIHNGGDHIVSMIDTVEGIIKKGEILLSQESAKILRVNEGEGVSVSSVSPTESIEIIHKKLSCETLSASELKKVITDITNNVLVGAEIAYFVSSIYNCGMSFKETVDLTKAMVSTGKKLGLHKRLVVDKHSIGGVPGRATPIVVAICASAGLTMPKTSSRAITSPSGTADSMEVLCSVSFTPAQLRRIIKKTNACFVWGGTLGFAPADDKLIRVEKLLHVDPEPQLLASIISKKLSVGAKYALIDIPYGPGAKVKNKKEALNLKRKFERIGKKLGIKLECFLGHVEEPRGNGLGPLLEVVDVIQVLKRESSAYHLEKVSLLLAARLLELAGKVKKGKGIGMAKEILESGKAYKKFVEIVEAQGGNEDTFKKLKPARYREEIKSSKKGKVKELNIRKLNQTAIIAGCPADKAAGIVLNKHLHDPLIKGEVILTVYSESRKKLREAVDFLNKTKAISF